MKKLLFIVCAIMAFVFVNSCNSIKQTNGAGYERVRFVFREDDVEIINSIQDVDGILNFLVTIDTTINDHRIISEYIELLDELEEDTTDLTYDLRVVSYLYTKEGDSSIVAIGTPCVFINDKRMKESVRLRKFVDKYLYSKENFIAFYNKYLYLLGRQDSIGTSAYYNDVEEQYKLYKMAKGEK